jgi:uncharacterized lipoprotein NlpE involved in copper resistance
MKKIGSIFFAIMLALGTSALAQAPGKGAGTADAVHDSKNGLDWDGVYTGTTPSASGPGIEVTVILRKDSTYTVLYHYVDTREGDFISAGSFKWNKAGSVITLDAKDIPPHYRIGKDKLIQLDMEGQPITGTLADLYVLRKLR